MTTNMRLLYNNAAAATTTTVAASSELAGFAVSKLFDGFRFTGWRPTGAFEITSTNKKIYINDGSDKTITLTEATYTTGALLAAQIQTQLNASSTLWSCTYSTTTYKFTIGRSSGTSNLRLGVTTDSLWNAIGFLGGSTVSSGVATVADVLRIHTSEYITFDLGEARLIESLIAIGATDADFSIPATATVTLKANSINSFSAAPLSVTITPDDFGLFKFLDDIDDTTYRYWRLDIADIENPSGPSVIDLRVLYLGDYETFANRNVNNGFQSRMVDQSLKTYSESGVAYNRIKSRYWVFSVGIEWLSSADRLVLRDMFLEVGNHQPFFVSIDPTALISESVGEFTKLVTVEGEFDQQHLLFDNFSQSLSFREVIG